MFPNAGSKTKQDLQLSQGSQVKKMLNLNKSQDLLSEEETSCVWKIIVYDKYCHDILSTLFKVFKFITHNIYFFGRWDI